MSKKPPWKPPALTLGDAKSGILHIDQERAFEAAARQHRALASEDTIDEAERQRLLVMAGLYEDAVKELAAKRISVELNRKRAQDGADARALESRTPVAFVHTPHRNASGLIDQVVTEPIVPENDFDESALR